MSVRILTCCIAIFVVSCALGTANSATIGHKSNVIVGKRIVSDNTAKPALRQAQDYSGEDSDEDDEEDDAERLQFNIQQQQQLQEDSLEDSDEDEGDNFDDDDYRRKRRDTAVAAPSEDNKISEDIKKPEDIKTQEPNKESTLDSEEDTKKDEIPTVAAATPPRKPSVLILIRDALKKVTTLPTEQVATNALQYFQLFEHFLQQTIEQVIDNVDDDDDEEATTVKSEEEINSPPEEEDGPIKEPVLVNKAPTEAPAEANKVPIKEVEGEVTIKKPALVDTIPPEAQADANKLPLKENDKTPSAEKITIQSPPPKLQSLN